jgi:hypothetical protein
MNEFETKFHALCNMNATHTCMQQFLVESLKNAKSHLNSLKELALNNQKQLLALPGNEMLGINALQIDNQLIYIEDFIKHVSAELLSLMVMKH